MERVVERKEEMGRGMEKGIHEVEKEWRNDEGYIYEWREEEDNKRIK